jgi:hypothetical protein
MPRFQMLTFFIKGFMFKLLLPGTLIAKSRFLGHYLYSTSPLGFAQEITCAESKPFGRRYPLSP